MPTSLSDPSPVLYFVLIVALVAAVVAWVRLRSRRTVIATAIFAGLLALLYLVDFAFESPREEATRNVFAMAEAFSAHDPNKFMEHVSAGFKSNGADKAKLKASEMWARARQHSIRAAVWGFERADATQAGDEIEIGFYAKGAMPDGNFALRYVRTNFVKDPDGQLRMKGMKFYNPADRGTRTEDPIPGFP